YVEPRLELHPARLGGAYQVVEDPVGDRLMERAFVAVGPHVLLERLQFDAKPVGDVVEQEHGEIGLSRHRAQAGELRDLHVDPVVAPRRGVRKSRQPFARTGSHWLSKNGRKESAQMLSFSRAVNSNKAVWF